MWARSSLRTIVWELLDGKLQRVWSMQHGGVAQLTGERNGTVLATDTTFEAAYITSQDSAYLYLPSEARNVQVYFVNVSSGATVAESCPTAFTSSLGFTTDANPFASSAMKLPLAWQNIDASAADTSQCAMTSTGDAIDVYTLDASVSPTHLSGSIDIQITGAGPRAGSTLHVCLEHSTRIPTCDVRP